MDPFSFDPERVLSSALRFIPRWMRPVHADHHASGPFPSGSAEETLHPWAAYPMYAQGAPSSLHPLFLPIIP